MNAVAAFWVLIMVLNGESYQIDGPFTLEDCQARITQVQEENPRQELYCELTAVSD